MEIKKICVIHLNQIGDLVFSLPVLKALKDNYPGAILHCVVKPYLKGLLIDSPFVDDIFIRPDGIAERTRLAQTIRRNRYDLLISLARSEEAMLTIRDEIRAIEDGKVEVGDSPLRNAPHTAADLAGDWTHGYSREQAAYPVSGLYESKFWAPVGRVDNVFGDRNLVCACPPPEAWVTEPHDDE